MISLDTRVTRSSSAGFRTPESLHANLTTAWSGKSKLSGFFARRAKYGWPDWGARDGEELRVQVTLVQRHRASVRKTAA